MAQLKILDKIARNCDQLGLAYTRTATTVVFANGGNALTVSLVDASIDSPMGGVSPASSPFLGIGVAAPCTIKIKSSGHGADTFADVLNTILAVQVLCLVRDFANDTLLENGDAGWSYLLRGNVDIVGLGQ